MTRSPREVSSNTLMATRVTSVGIKMSVDKHQKLHQKVAELSNIGASQFMVSASLSAYVTRTHSISDKHSKFKPSG
jgi:hypothetical protein